MTGAISKNRKRSRKIVFLLVMMGLLFIRMASVAFATEPATTTPTPTPMQNPLFGVSITTGDEENLAGSIQIIILLTIISLAPSILVLMTSFTRIIIVLHFTRQGVGTMTAPPNQVLVGLALFLTFFIMAPVFSDINTTAIQPLTAGTITQEEAFTIASDRLKIFMMDQTNRKDLDLMLEIGNYEIQENVLDYSLTVVIPSFILSELRNAFIMGFLIYIPFIAIDMVVSSVLMSMGMMMLPPTTISMPFKILLFVLADGWNLIIVNLMRTFVIQ